MLGKSVFMTGASGFIGSHLSEELEMRGMQVFTHDREDGDLAKYKSFPDVDYVIHLAAYNSTKDFYNDGYLWVSR